MDGVSRRIFLRRGSLAVAAAGALSAIPGLSGLLVEGEADAPGAAGAAAGTGSEAGAALGADAASGETLVAHLRDASTGEITIFAGERRLVIRSPQIAAQLLRAAR